MARPLSMILPGLNAISFKEQILNEFGNTFVQGMRGAITVAAPFYGAGSQVHRFFIGDPQVNGTEGVQGAQIVTEIISPLPAGYEMMFLDGDTYDANQAAFMQDPDGFNLPAYPSVDANSGARADPYHPDLAKGQSDSGFVRYISSYGFDWNKLVDGLAATQAVSQSLDASVADKFTNIRGVQGTPGAIDSRPPIDNVDQARDMLDLLRAGRNGESGGPTPREEIVDQVGTMLSAGFITTALALFWTVLMLALFPSHQEAVRRDLCQDGATAPPEWSLLRSSRTSTAFLYETLRLFPPAYVIAREAQVEDRIGDFRIPRGAAVIIAPWVVHSHAAHWREPDRFDPDRFLQDGRVATPPAWMSYGVGPRVCIGSAFATMEILVVLRSLLSRYAVRLRGRPPRPIGRVTLTPDFQPLFTLTPL
jgi:hypothetical protein